METHTNFSVHAICNREVSCGHMGKRDVEQHISKDIHQTNVKAAKSQRTLTFQPRSSSLTKKVHYQHLHYCLFCGIIQAIDTQGVYMGG